MAFHFQLQAVLHLRQSVEHQLELRLRAANQQVLAMQHGIDQVEARKLEMLAARSRELKLGISSAELQFRLRREEELARYRADLELQLQRLQKQRDQALEFFQQARRMRETLEAVRDRQLAEYQKQALRREQRNLDDMFLLRREYLRRG